MEQEPEEDGDGGPDEQDTGHAEGQRRADEGHEGGGRVAGGDAVGEHDEAALQHGHHAERHDQGRQAQQGDAEAVDEPDAEGCAPGSQDGGEDEAVLPVHQVAGDDRAERDHRADGEIDPFPPAQHHEVLPGRRRCRGWRRR